MKAKVITICQDDDCRGAVRRDSTGVYCCTRCNSIWENIQDDSTTAVFTISPLSQQYDPTAAPTAMRDVPPRSGTERSIDFGNDTNHGGSASGNVRGDSNDEIMVPPARRNVLGDGLVRMPVVVEGLMPEVDIRPPLRLRVCSSLTCVDTSVPPDADGNLPRTKLYREASSDIPKLDAGSRLETDTDLTTGKSSTYIVRDVGFCRVCGKKFNFLPIKKGTMAGDVEIDRPFAHGANSIVYRGYHHGLKVPVAIKAPLNIRNAGTIDSAQTERDALAALVGAPGVVQIYGCEPYGEQFLLILELLKGKTLHDVRELNGGALSIEIGLSYFIALIAAVMSVQEKGRIVLDIKPKNIIVLEPGDQLKLIDLAGSYVPGQTGARVEGTAGYAARELVEMRPCQASDTFAVFRVLCFLSLNFSLLSYPYTLPTPAEEPLFRTFPSLYRLGLLCTADNPADRPSLAHILDQAIAVRAEIVALKQGRATTIVSSIFERYTAKGVDSTHPALPDFLMDGADPAAGALKEALDDPDRQAQRLAVRNLLNQFPTSIETKLRLASVAIDTGDLSSAAVLLNRLRSEHPSDCRSVYHLGRLALAEGDLERAAKCFNACYSNWPGEAAIKLANGYVAEQKGDYAAASWFYETLARVNSDYLASVFGWARTALQTGDRYSAVKAYELVPRTSWAFREAIVGKVRALIDIVSSTVTSKNLVRGVMGVGLPELLDAARSAEFIFNQGESFEISELKAQLFETALTALDRGAFLEDKTVSLLGVPILKKELRAAAAAALNICAEQCKGEGVAKKFQQAKLKLRARKLGGGGGFKWF